MHMHKIYEAQSRNMYMYVSLQVHTFVMEYNMHANVCMYVINVILYTCTCKYMYGNLTTGRDANWNLYGWRSQLLGSLLARLPIIPDWELYIDTVLATARLALTMAPCMHAQLLVYKLHLHLYVIVPRSSLIVHVAVRCGLCNLYINY